MALDRVRAQADELDTTLGELWLKLRESAQLRRTSVVIVRTRPAITNTPIPGLTLACNLLGARRERPN